VGDLNGDGQLDLATANLDAATVSIRLGRGNGTFEAVPGVGVGSGPNSVTVGDLNGDGQPDLATANRGANTVSIRLGRGDGTFLVAQEFGVGRTPFSVTGGDFNGDGRLDLATANAGASTVSILLNNTPEIVVNDLVTFEPFPDTFTFTPDPAGCPRGFVGTFRFEARLTNVSEHTLSTLIVVVTRITNFNLLHNADDGPGGTGARLTVPHAEDFTDGVLSPGEFIDVLFRLCLTARRPFRFEVAVLGAAE
jgi:hypothetical protein